MWPKRSVIGWRCPSLPNPIAQSRQGRARLGQRVMKNRPYMGQTPFDHQGDLSPLSAQSRGQSRRIVSKNFRIATCAPYRGAPVKSAKSGAAKGSNGSRSARYIPANSSARSTGSRTSRALFSTTLGSKNVRSVSGYSAKRPTGLSCPSARSRVIRDSANPPPALSPNDDLAPVDAILQEAQIRGQSIFKSGRERMFRHQSILGKAGPCLRQRGEIAQHRRMGPRTAKDISLAVKIMDHPGVRIAAVGPECPKASRTKAAWSTQTGAGCDQDRSCAGDTVSQPI